MADKTVPLSIIIRTVDRATAGINAVNKRLDALTKPTREFGKALAELGEKSGFNRVGEAFREVGKATKEVLFKLLEGAVIIGEATHLVLEMVEGFSKLHDTAAALGIDVDLLTGLGYAASKSGSSVEALDEGLSTLAVNMGAAKANTGKMLKFLNEISPVFARQVVHANSLGEATGLIADAMAKLPDAARRAKLAAATFGDPKLAATLARGSKGIQELIEEHNRLSGSQQEAADQAAKVDDALKELHASTDGVKAALVTGLAPALTEIIGKMTTWLVEHREDVRRWAEDIGKKLPAAVDQVVTSVKGAVRWAGEFVDGIGGWKVAAVGLAAVIAGPLVSAIVTLGAAMVATPFGQIALAVAAFSAAAAEAIGIGHAIGSAGGPPSKRQRDSEARLRESGALPRRHGAPRTPAERRLQAAGVMPFASWAPAAPFWTFDDVVQAPATPAAAPAASPQGNITVQFANAPKGMRVTADPKLASVVDLSVGYQMGGAW